MIKTGEKMKNLEKLTGKKSENKEKLEEKNGKKTIDIRFHKTREKRTKNWGENGETSKNGK